MKVLKYIWVALLIISILLPMLLFLNPFVWGMRRAPEYIPSERLEKVLLKMDEEINKIERTEIYTYNNEPNLWYLRDCENQKLDSLNNFKIDLTEIKSDSFIREKIKKYAPLIEKEIECKCYDSLIFSYQLRVSEHDLTEVAVGFKIKSK
ncbi:hypothetical protein [Flavobacterium sp.]|uniref:hypothetical protein n=1 Tax=Flavobacterium sp. TaxID=239 RepID=UPI0031D563B7